MKPHRVARKNTTGGWRWHARAVWRRRMWKPTRDHLADWLGSIHPASNHLLLIGGSAGWMMSSAWLQRFSRVDLIDIDPLAPQLFRLNHGQALKASNTELRIVVEDGLKGLDHLLSQHPQASVLFDNVLGQQIFLTHDVEETEAELARLTSRLKGRDWGSIHDLFSGPVRAASVPAGARMGLDALMHEKGLSVDGLMDQPLHEYLLAQVGGFPYWMDHLTSALFPSGTRSRLIAWPFSESYAHWLQAGWVHQSA